MNYLFITLDAIEQFVSIRQFQSSEYSESKMLCNVLKGNIDAWNNSKINLHYSASEGLFFFTEQINRNSGILFDFSSFDAFRELSPDKMITIFQKTLKYAIRYFRLLPLAPCEKFISDTNTTMVYPFPFTATRDAYKVLVDRNSSKHRRSGGNFLIVFYSGIDSNGNKVQFTNLNKAVDSLKNLSFQKNVISEATTCQNAINITGLDNIDLSIDAKIGFENWNYYLTENQKDFINKEVEGPERLEGAAGTGKTLTMILRCINIIRIKIKQGEDYHIVFITHSLSSKEQIIDILKNNDPEIAPYICNDEDSTTMILVTTLQEWCIKYLGADIHETEYLDKDARDSKGMQKMYIAESFSKIKEFDLDTYKKICSESFISFLEKTNEESLIEMLQYEIAVIIKGRAGGDIEKYKELERPQYSIPCKNDNDLNLLFLIYREYQSSLEASGQYDSDDIVLTALGQLNTPIWKRRRNKEGFNVCFIDETHLFNLNELSIFHYLNRENAKNNIIFAIDKSQAVGERGILDETMFEILKVERVTEKSLKFETVFRSSPLIIDLAFNILSSGVTLFTNFENPLNYSISSFTEEEELKCTKPKYRFIENDYEMIVNTFNEVDQYSRKFNTSKAKVLIIAATDQLFYEIEKFANENHKPIEIIKSRGDSNAIKNATIANKYVIGGIDYVGGLEFDAVIILGIDKGRVPPIKELERDSFHFLNYAWHNRLYVAVTRAKYSVLLLGDKNRGMSPLLESASYLEIVDVENL